MFVQKKVSCNVVLKRALRGVEEYNHVCDKAREGYVNHSGVGLNVRLALADGLLKINMDTTILSGTWVGLGSTTVRFYGPKSRVSTQGAHAAQTRACQDEEPKTEQTAKWHGGAVPRSTVVPCGTMGPCHVARSCPQPIFAALFWPLGFGVEGVFSAAVRAFPGGGNPTFQAL